ncbi:ABC-type antimicrobial peptide transport system, permease component [Chitinophaga sp. CF118]|uniref:ABC transporter permease n=1 Tax=Chitinophaga sp. CF118 TaxID=1884367 RepID=UPI0008F42D6E|nr:ABC transporter permease [Chitinophaga sp. CF118]SFD64182.1 ABC-type antimicrobial peptide transport system, permease component [Chitinophaga sp. CF118]
MFRYNLRTAWRRFLRDRQFTILNLIGLSTGLAAALLICLWVSDEISVNKFHKKDGQLYKVMNNLKSSQGIQTMEITPVPLAESLMKEMPEVEYAVAVNDFFNWQSKEGVLSSGNAHIQAQGWNAGKDFFNVFSYDLIQGNKDQALADENNIVISTTLAKKLFNTTDNVIGKTLEWKYPFFEGVFRVSGIFKDPPANSTGHFDFVLNIGVLLKNDRSAKTWTNYLAETYLILRKGTNVDQFNKKIAGYLKVKNPGLDIFSLFLQQYSSKYLNGKYENGIPAGGRITYVRLFSIIALFILLIACINFMNLSTAQASGKMKEVGVKKAIGANRKSLIVQFLTESILMAFLSLAIAFVFIALSLPQFNAITGKHIELKNTTDFILPVVAITLFTGIISGCYPAFYLSGFNAVAVLKGKLRTSFGELWVRKGLVVVQFIISVVFIIGFLIINEQIKYSQTRSLGYNKDNVLCFQWKGALYNQWNRLSEGKSNERFDAFIAGLKNVTGVISATNTYGNILDQIPATSGVSWRGLAADQSYLFKSPVVGYDFLETLDMKLKEGRSFSRMYNDDYSKIILNESAVKMMGLNNPVGKDIDLNGRSQIIGVVKDFHYGSLHNSIEPLILRFDPNGPNIMVRIKAGTEINTVEQLKRFYGEFLPGYTFDFTFMDDDYLALYTSEMRVAALSRYFAVLAILISCLGLFGLAAFTAQKRQKEISIRKVLGATVSDVSIMLSGDFLKLVFFAVVIALPVAWWAMNKWLESFSDRVTINWWFFIVPGMMALLLAMITVGFQSIKAAIDNPVKSLRAE